MIRTFGRHVPKVHPKAFVHESAEVIGMVTLKAQASIYPHCSVRGDVDRIVIGERSNIQDLTMIHTRDDHPTVIGKEVTVGHHVVLHGCRIGDRCLIGMGAIVMETTIGKGSLVAAGSLVLAGTKIPPNSLVMGSPAKVVRKVTAKERQHILYGIKSYLQKTEIHRKKSKVVAR
jgi:carbonic anhydrase/acetyltransferase-like protein (isoleucine patch superfamily)